MVSVFVKCLSCFITYEVICPEEWSMSVWEERLFCSCWVECFVYCVRVNWSIELFKSAVSLLIFVWLFLTLLLKRGLGSCLQFTGFMSCAFSGYDSLQRSAEKVVQFWFSMCILISKSHITMVKLENRYWGTYIRLSETLD